MRNQAGTLRQRHPHIKFAGERKRIKLLLGHADNSEDGAIQPDGLADGGSGAAKRRLPEAVIQDCHGRGLRSVVAFKKQPPQVRTNSDSPEIIAGDKLAAHDARLPVAAQVKLLIPGISRHMRKHCVLFLYISKERQRQGTSVGIWTVTVVLTLAKTPVAHGLGTVVGMPLKKDQMLRIR